MRLVIFAFLCSKKQRPSLGLLWRSAAASVLLVGGRVETDVDGSQLVRTFGNLVQMNRNKCVAELSASSHRGGAFVCMCVRVH